MPSQYPQALGMCAGGRIAGIQKPDGALHPTTGNREQLITIPGLHGNPLAALGAAAREHGLSTLGLHTGPESVRLRAVTTIGLECALRH